MKFIIRNMTKRDRDYVINMMRVFYASPAVHTNGSEEIFASDVENCINDSPYLEGYVFESGDKIIGYAMLAKSFSTEFGKPCIWIEDIYVLDEYRGNGVASAFFKYVEAKYPNSILRLEVEEDNERALGVYKKCGFEVMPYMEMKK